MQTRPTLDSFLQDPVTRVKDPERRVFFGEYEVILSPLDLGNILCTVFDGPERFSHYGLSFCELTWPWL